MKRIAIPTNRDFVEQHLGRCRHYTIVTMNTAGDSTATEVIRSEGSCGCKSDIMNVLRKRGVTLLLAGHMGNGAAEKFRHAGIDIIRGCSGPVDALIDAYREGQLHDSGVSCGKHHH